MNNLIYSSGYILSEPMTGGKKRFLELTNKFVNYYHFDLCCADSKDDLKKIKIKKDYDIVCVNKHSIFPPEFLNLIKNRKTIIKIKRKKYDNIIVFDVPPAIGLCLFGFKNIVLMIRKDLIGYEKVKFEKKKLCYYIKLLYQWLSEDICIKKSKLIICQCEYDKNVMLSRHKRLIKKNASKFKVQINNVNPSWIVEKSKIDNNNIDNEVNDSKFNLCFVGNFNDARKGHDLILDAMNKINDKNIVLYLIGGGKKLEYYKNKFENSNIIFLGKMENPIKFIKLCNLMIVPSLADSCPNTILESLYNGIPVIGKKSGGIPELLNNPNCLFNNVEELVNMINIFYKDSNSINKLINEQKKRKKELSFDWSEKIYNIIIN